MKELQNFHRQKINGGIVFLAPIVAGMGGGSNLAMAGAAAIHIGGRLAQAYGLYSFFAKK